MHNASVRLLANGKAEIWHDWLAGIGEAQLDSSGHLVHYSGARTTYKVDVVRTPDTANVSAIANSFAAIEAKNGGAKELSVRDTVRAGEVVYAVDHPAAKRHGGVDRQQADAPVGHAVQRSAGPRHNATTCRDRHCAGRRVYDLDRADRRERREPRDIADGMGNASVDGADRSGK